MTQLAERWRAASGRQKMAVIAALIYLFYAVIVYFAGSSMLRQTIVEELENTTGRAVSLERAVIDPTGLAVTLTNFRFDDPDGEAFVAFDRLYVDFELSSLFRWSWHFDVVELDAPRIRVSQTGSKAFNFDDLLALGGEQPEPEPEPSSPAALPALSIGELRLAGGDFRFIDLTRGEAQELVLDDLDFEILDFSTRSDGEDGNQYALAIASPDGGRFDWTGRLNVDPLILDGRLELSGLALAPFAEFYQDRLRFQMRDGELDIATGYLLDMSGDVPLVQLSEGRIALTDLQLQQPEQEEDTLVLPELVFSGISMNSATETVAVAAIDIDGLAVLARQTESGLDLASVFVPLPPPAAQGSAEEVLGDEVSAEAPDDPTVVQEVSEGEPPAAPEQEQPEVAFTETPEQTEEAASSGWRAKVDRVAIAQGQFVFRDETLLTPAQLAATEMALTLTNLTWGEEGEFSWQGGLTLSDQDQLTLSGTGTLQPLALQAAVSSERLSLLPLEPWLRESASVDLVAGNLAFDVGATLAEGEDAPALSLQIVASLSELALTELDGEPLLSLALADVDQVSVDFDEPGVALGKVTVTGLNLNSMIDEQGRHTGDRVVVPVQAPVHVGETPVWHISLDEFDLRDSQVVFRDDSQSAPFSLGL